MYSIAITLICLKAGVLPVNCIALVRGKLNILGRFKSYLANLYWLYFFLIHRMILLFQSVIQPQDGNMVKMKKLNSKSVFH